MGVPGRRRSTSTCSSAPGSTPRPRTRAAVAAGLRAHGRPTPPFSRDSLLGWLSSQCVEAFRPALPADAFDSFRAEMFAAVDRLRRHDGTYDQTFVRLDALAYRTQLTGRRARLESSPF